MRAERVAAPKVRVCPICGKPATAESRPFCSERCRDVDLNRWLSGSYAIPVRADDDEDGDAFETPFPERVEKPE